MAATDTPKVPSNRRNLFIAGGAGVVLILCSCLSYAVGASGKGAASVATVIVTSVGGSGATLAPLPTYTPYPTLAPLGTPAPGSVVTQLVTQIIVITATPLPATNTPAKTDTPAPTDTAIPTANSKTATAQALGPLVAPRTDGNYVVNLDIAPGVWRNDGTGSDGTNCYWQRLNKAGDTINNYLGSGKGTMTIQTSDFSVHMENCGNWVYLTP